MKDSFKELTLKEIVTQKNELKKKYRDLRFNMIIGHVDNPLQKRVLRRQIARLNTVIHEFNLGIRKE